MNDIERLVLEMIGEDPDTPDVFTEGSDALNQVRDSINDAIEEISIVTSGYKDILRISMRSGRAFYRMDYTGGQIAWITDAWLTTQRIRLEQTDLIKLCAYNPRFMLDSSPPRAYFPIGLNWLGFWPKPSADTDIVELQCVIVPKRYSSGTDRIKVRNDLDLAAANYAIGEYYASRGDAKQAIDHHNRYLKDVGIDMPYMSAADYQFRMRSDKEYWPKVTG